MHQALVLLQLSLWATSIHAFYPFVPSYRIDEGRDGAKRDGRGDTTLDARTTRGDGSVTFQISQRAHDAKVGLVSSLPLTNY